MHPRITSQSRRSSARRSLRTVGAPLLAAALCGCTAYEPKPLDLDATRAEWLARSVDDESVRAFAARLGEVEPGRAPFDVSDGLSLAEAEAVGVVFNRELRVARRQASVARATAENSGLWDDPILGVELEKIIQDVPNPWIVGASIGITIPISGRLDAERIRADTALAAELERIAAQEWTLRADVRSAWIEWSAQELRVELLQRFVDEVDAVATLAKLQEDAGILARVDGRLFHVELASRRAELAVAKGLARERELILRDRLGMAPDAPVKLIPQVALEPAATAASGWSELERRNLELAAARRDYDVAEAALALEVRKQYPDLTIGPGYKTDQGDDRVILGISLPIPLWNRNQQGVAEAIALRDRANEEFGSIYERLVSSYEVARTRHDSARLAREALDRDLLPLVDTQDSEVRRSAELGRLDPLLLLEALRSRFDARWRAIESRMNESIAASELDKIVGPPVPRAKGKMP